MRRHARQAARAFLWLLFWVPLAVLCLAGLSMSRLRCSGSLKSCFMRPLLGNREGLEGSPSSPIVLPYGLGSFSTTQVVHSDAIATHAMKQALWHLLAAPVLWAFTL
jgi:hypothetical protein